MGCPVTGEEAVRLSADLRRHDGPNRLIEALAHDESGRMLILALAWRAYLQEEADPARRVARLQHEARDLDHRAEPAWREAAEMHGKAAARSLRGEHELAADFLARARAAERVAAMLESQAFSKRLEAARLQSRTELCLSLAGIAA